MVPLLAAATFGMALYVVWLVVFRLRKDRVLAVRATTRGKHAFRPRERVRFLLQRAFNPPPEREEWEDRLVAHLARVPAGARATAPRPAARRDF